MNRLAITLAFGLCSFTCLAETVKLDGPVAFQASQKTTCGTLAEGQVRYGIWQGRSWARVPGEKDRRLFDLIGINTRSCSVMTDRVRGRSYRSVSREIMAYLDPDTGEVIDTWTNPWTDEEITVVHVANDPVNMRSRRYENDEAGHATATMELRRYGNIAARSAEIPLFYDNPLGGDYQQYVGGTYHAMEIFNSFYDADKLLDPEVESLGDSHLSWSRVAQWLPWMEMGSRPGIMIFNTTGFSTFDKAKIPPPLMKILHERYPKYLTPPPLDDDRPNETSWTVFKKRLENAAN